MASAGGQVDGADDPGAQPPGPEQEWLALWARETAGIRPTRRSDWHLIAERVLPASGKRGDRLRAVWGPARVPAAAVLALVLLALVNSDFARAAESSWRAVTAMASSIAWEASERLPDWLVPDTRPAADGPTPTPTATLAATSSATPSPTPTLVGTATAPGGSSSEAPADDDRSDGGPVAPAPATPIGQAGPAVAPTGTDAPPAVGNDHRVQPTAQASPQRRRPVPSVEPTRRPPGERRDRPNPTQGPPVRPRPPRPTHEAPPPTRQAPPHPTRDDRRRPTRVIPTAVPPTDVPPEPTQSGPPNGELPPPPATPTPAVQSSGRSSA